jgi:hypothetical protein
MARGRDHVRGNEKSGTEASDRLIDERLATTEIVGGLIRLGLERVCVAFGFEIACFDQRDNRIGRPPGQLCVT